jgi:hypothetical protein
MFVRDWPLTKLSELQVLKKSDLKKNGKNLIPDTFFVHGFHSEVLEEHHTTQGYDFSKWNEWLSEGRIYVEKEKDYIV